MMNTGKLRDEFVQVVEGELKKCSRCGSCASVCPIFAEKFSESCCARGKLQLAQSVIRGSLEMTKPLAAIFNNCLMCLTCRENCPGGVCMDKVLLAARALFAAEGKQSKTKRLVFERVLASPPLMCRAMRIGSALQPLFFARVPESSGLWRRFPLPLIKADQPIPRITPVPFRSRVPERLETSAPTRKGAVLYFVGCATNFLFPTIGESVVYVLRRLGYDVIIPPTQGCCGTPVEIAGEVDIWRRLVEANLKAFSGSDLPIITACGSCGLMWRHGCKKNNGVTQREAAWGAARNRDIAEFLAERCSLEEIAAGFVRMAQPVLTYHESCHMGRGLKIRQQPRELLRALAPHYVEMPDSDRCCGSGGTYGYTHWSTVRGILQKKIANIKTSQATVVATGCPACVLQLDGGLRNVGELGASLHTAELLAWAMGYLPERKDERWRFAMLEDWES